MLTWEDCLGLVELTEDEIAVIAHHEHLPQLAALELGNYLVEHEGCHKIRRMIMDDIEAAHRAHDPLRVLTLKLALKRFVDCHRARLSAEEAGVSFPAEGECGEMQRPATLVIVEAEADLTPRR
jgi:hypothetical protein